MTARRFLHLLPRRAPNALGTRIALATLAVALISLAILAAGVVVMGSGTFAALMAKHGFSTASSEAMFQASVIQVLLVATAVAFLAALVMAAFLAARLGRPLREIGIAARRIAQGQYATHIERQGPEEIVSLADSFNQMADALEAQEQTRREFIANAAHELRTPLTNLEGYLEALRDGVIAPDRAAFESLLEEAERLLRLSRALDTLAEGDAAASPLLVDLDVGAAVRTAVELARPAALGAGLEVEVEAPTLLVARAVPDQLAEVLANLLQNAVRYSPEGGRVTVRVERRRSDVLVSVSNTGAEIPAADLPHLFERFYRVDKSRSRAHGGAGIGLAIVKQLVESAGGRVGAESADGLTRVWFSLPRKAAVGKAE